jgi:hypothetical protein
MGVIEMSDSQDTQVLGLPRQAGLPLFSYGLLKHDEFFYGTVQPFVKDGGVDVNVKIGGTLYEKDGIPLYVTDYSVDGTIGDVLTFADASAAYQAISVAMPASLYEWGELTLPDGRQANVLLCASSLRKADGSVHRAVLMCSAEWHSINDPLLDSGMAFLKKTFYNKLVNEEYVSGEAQRSIYAEIFEFQMAYALLWSIIERYSTFRYGIGKDKATVCRLLAGDDLLQKTLRAMDGHLWTKDGSTVDVATADGGGTVTFCFSQFISAATEGEALDRASEILSYYYQAQTLPVHRSRHSSKDLALLQNCFIELFVLMDNVVSAAIQHERRGEDSLYQFVSLT